jgi:hypothetical protein
MALKGSLGSSVPSQWRRGSSYVYDRQFKRPVKVDTTTGQSVEKSKSTKGTDYLTRYERAGTIGSGRSLERSGDAKTAQAKGKFEEASKSLNDYKQTAFADGQLRRSELIEMQAFGKDKQAAAAEGAAGRVRSARGQHMQGAAADGKLTAAEQKTTQGLRDAEGKLTDKASGLKGEADGLRDKAATVRAGELQSDVDHLKSITNVDAKRVNYTNARDIYNLSVKEAGGFKNLRNLPPEQRQELRGLELKKQGAWKDLVAEHKKANLIKTAEGALGDGKVTTAEQAGIDKQVKSVNLMQAESDKLTNLGKATIANANHMKAVKAIHTGNVRELFGSPWGRQFMSDHMMRHTMHDMGMPFMSPEHMMYAGSPFGRSIADFDSVGMQQAQLQQLVMQQQLMGSFGAGAFPFGPGLDFSMMW